MQIGTTKDQGLCNKPSAAVYPGALAAGTLPQYNTIQYNTHDIQDKKLFDKHFEICLPNTFCCGLRNILKKYDGLQDECNSWLKTKYCPNHQTAIYERLTRYYLLLAATADLVPTTRRR